MCASMFGRAVIKIGWAFEGAVTSNKLAGLEHFVSFNQQRTLALQIVTRGVAANLALVSAGREKTGVQMPSVLRAEGVWKA